MANPVTPDGEDTRETYVIIETCEYEIVAASRDDAEEIFLYGGRSIDTDKNITFNGVTERSIEVKS